MARALTSDRHKGLTGSIIQALTRIMGVRQVMTSSYHPQSNHVAETMNATILRSLRTLY